MTPDERRDLIALLREYHTQVCFLAPLAAAITVATFETAEQNMLAAQLVGHRAGLRGCIVQLIAALERDK